MNIDFSPLNYTFKTKPLLVGGKAMEYYGLRKAGADIDLVVTLEDITDLAKLYPQHLKDLWGDFGIAVHGFEIWKTISCRNYDALSNNSVDEINYTVASLETLQLMLIPAQHIVKYQQDLKLIEDRLRDARYEKNIKHVVAENKNIVSQLKNPQYVEISGPYNN